MRAAAAHEPIARIRRLYDAWNAGDVATAADVLSPDVRWDTFGAAKTAGPNAMQATLAAGSGGTWHLTAVSIDLLIGIGAHVLACSRRSGAAPERIEIWTLEHGKAVHYRGYPLDDGLAVLTRDDRRAASSRSPAARCSRSTAATAPPGCARSRATRASSPTGSPGAGSTTCACSARRSSRS